MDRLDINTFHMEEKIIHYANEIICPNRYIELYFADFLTDNNINFNIKGNQAIISSTEKGYLVDSSGTATKYTRDDLYLTQISSFHAQHWYPELPIESTFKSVLIPLDGNNVQELLNLKNIKFEPSDILIKKLEDAIDGIFIPGDEIFVRLNSLSPKAPKNRIKITFTSSWVYKMLDLIVNSSRTYDTLSLPYTHYIMLRKWENILADNEFRCFIYQNKLTAISQYHCYNYYKSLQDPSKQNNIKKQIKKFFDKIFSYLIYEDCVMDIILVDIDKSWEKLGVKIIEFNSFGADSMAGSALYNWIRDEEILLGKENEVDLRIVTEKRNKFNWH